jgi:hypothetical protein
MTTIDRKLVYVRLMTEANKIRVDEADWNTWGGPDPRGPDEQRINLKYAQKLEELAKEFLNG